MAAPFPMVLGCTSPIDVQLAAADTDPAVAVDLTGATGMAAKATLADGTGTTITLTAAVLGAATGGIVRISPASNSFPALGLYSVQISYTSSSGKACIWPSDGNSLRLNVKGAIT